MTKPILFDDLVKELHTPEEIAEIDRDVDKMLAEIERQRLAAAPKAEPATSGPGRKPTGEPSDRD